MVHTCNLGTWKTDAGGSEIQDHLKLELNSGLHMTLTQTTKKPTKWHPDSCLKAEYSFHEDYCLMRRMVVPLCPSEGGDVGSTS